MSRRSWPWLALPAGMAWWGLSWVARRDDGELAEEAAG